MFLLMTQCTGLHGAGPAAQVDGQVCLSSAEPRQKGTDLKGTYSDFEDKICWRSYIRNEVTGE